MAELTRDEFIALVISGIIIGAAMLYLQPIIDSWSNDRRFIVASIFVIVGELIARKFRGKARKNELLYRTVGNALFCVGMTMILIPLINWITERTVSRI